MTAYRSAVGRADLVRALGAPGGDSATMASFLGYHREESSPAESFFFSEDEVTTEAEPFFSPPPKLNFAPIPFLRVVNIEYFDDEGEPSESTPLQKIDLDPDLRTGPPPADPLVPWPRLWRVLEDVFRERKRGARLDVKALVHDLARGRVIRHLPRRRIPAMGRVTLLLDRSRRLVPFWQDQITLALALRQKLGPNALDIGIVPKQGPEHITATNGIVLVVSDLGLFGEPGLAKAWEEAGLRLARGGARLRALLPCPRNRWLASLSKLWNAIEWENPAFEAKPAPLAEQGELNHSRDQILGMLLPAIRVEPGLLRAIRKLLGPNADAGTEADVWREFPNPSPVAATPPEDLSRRLEGSKVDESLRRKAFELIQKWHGALPPLVLAEETFSSEGQRAATSSDYAAAREVLRAAMAEVRQRGVAGAPLLTHWFQEFSQRLPGEIADRELEQELGATWAVLYSEDPTLPLPSWVSPALLAALEPAGELRHLEIWQRGNEIVLSPKGRFPGGSLLGEIRSSSNHVQVFSSTEYGFTRSVSRSFRSEGVAEKIVIGLDELPHALRLVSNLAAVELEAEHRPAWASAAGRDRYGLWADLKIEGVIQRMRFIFPGRFLMGSPETEQGRWENEGPQHMVTLTEGFWLADTPCTQAFWQAVMGNNPSRFRSPRRPVEQASWNDVQQFLRRLNESAAQLKARLPTEAQWEYACRAGTTTSTYAGELHIWGENNGPILDGIAWYGGNSGVAFELEDGYDSSRWQEKQYEHGKAGTREVALKKANGWGLYDTLGNVWEWCSDYGGRYSPEPQMDLAGPESGSNRVYRGGSWINDARSVRSAARDWVTPGYRNHYLGFRLSLGQLRSSTDSRRRGERARQ